MRLVLPLLILPALPAAAEPVIAFSGKAEFGVTYQDGKGSEPHDRLSLDLAPQVRTDSGLAIGAQTRLRARTGGDTALAAPRYYITTGSPGALPRR